MAAVDFRRSNPEPPNNNLTCNMATSQPYYSQRVPQPHQQPTPLSSAEATPVTMSPTSPRPSSTSPSHFMIFPRQMHPPKNPLYTPAVLRPTERPSRHAHSKSSSSNSVAKVVVTPPHTASPLTPPSSAPNSFDSREGATLVEESLQRRLLANDGISRVVTDEWNEEALEDVTGLPTRDHWKPDSSSPACDYPPCPHPFTLIRRRHHCRRCGNIFCSTHSNYEVPLDQHARFHPQGTKARACDSCWTDFQAWRRMRKLREGSVSSESGGRTPTTAERDCSEQDKASTRHLSSSGSARTRADPPVVGSVPRDWSWSTF